MQRLDISLLILAAIPMVVSCSQSDAELVIREVVEATKTFDAGIVFTDQEHRIAFPLNDPKIKQASDVKKIESSCDCAELTIADYLNSQESRCCALVVYFAKDSKRYITGHQVIVDANVLHSQGVAAIQINAFLVSTPTGLSKKIKSPSLKMEITNVR